MYMGTYCSNIIRSNLFVMNSCSIPSLMLAYKSFLIWDENGFFSRQSFSLPSSSNDVEFIFSSPIEHKVYQRSRSCLMTLHYYVKLFNEIQCNSVHENYCVSLLGTVLVRSIQWLIALVAIVFTLIVTGNESCALLSTLWTKDRRCYDKCAVELAICGDWETVDPSWWKGERWWVKY